MLGVGVSVLVGDGVRVGVPVGVEVGGCWRWEYHGDDHCRYTDAKSDYDDERNQNHKDF